MRRFIFFLSFQSFRTGSVFNFKWIPDEAMGGGGHPLRKQRRVSGIKSALSCANVIILYGKREKREHLHDLNVVKKRGKSHASTTKVVFSSTAMWDTTMQLFPVSTWELAVTKKKHTNALQDWKWSIFFLNMKKKDWVWFSLWFYNIIAADCIRNGLSDRQH